MPTATEVARAASVVFTCLPSPEASLAVYCGPEGLLSADAAGALFIELSSVDPATAVRLGAACTEIGARFLDAPVSGGPKAAADGALTAMIGGNEDAVAEADPYLATFAAKRVRMCGVGAGSVAKVCNQMLVGITYLAIAEAMVLGTKAGLAPELLYEVLRTSSGRSALLDYALPQFMLPRRFEAAFQLDCLAKDLDCVERAAKTTGARVQLAAVAKQAYQEAELMGLGPLDAAVILLSTERAADVHSADALRQVGGRHSNRRPDLV